MFVPPISTAPTIRLRKIQPFYLLPLHNRALVRTEFHFPTRPIHLDWLRSFRRNSADRTRTQSRKYRYVLSLWFVIDQHSVAAVSAAKRGHFNGRLVAAECRLKPCPVPKGFIDAVRVLGLIKGCGYVRQIMLEGIRAQQSFPTA